MICIKNSKSGRLQFLGGENINGIKKIVSTLYFQDKKYKVMIMANLYFDKVAVTSVLMTGRVSPQRAGSASLTEAGPTQPTVTKFAGGATRELAPTTQKIRS